MLRAARAFVARPDNDFTWSSWHDAEHALGELDELDVALAAPAGTLPAHRIAIVFVPTGPMHELAISSGWSGDFGMLADEIGAALEACATHSSIRCGMCAEIAGSLQLVDGAEVVRRSFTGTLTRAVGADELGNLRAALRDDDAGALLAIDPELAPFHCPECEQSYCGAHWAHWDVFDDDEPSWHDSIRGRCPQGHERMLED